LSQTSATTYWCTLSLHDALPIYLGDADIAGGRRRLQAGRGAAGDGDRKALQRAGAVARGQIDLSGVDNVEVVAGAKGVGLRVEQDRNSTRLNSSHQIISYAVFCL